MKLTIRPPIEIDVYGEKCMSGCQYLDYHNAMCTWFQTMKYKVKQLKEDENTHHKIRCQACLDAEKEGNNANQTKIR